MSNFSFFKMFSTFFSIIGRSFLIFDQMFSKSSAADLLYVGNCSWNTRYFLYAVHHKQLCTISFEKLGDKRNITHNEYFLFLQQYFQLFSMINFSFIKILRKFRLVPSIAFSKWSAADFLYVSTDLCT